MSNELDLEELESNLADPAPAPVAKAKTKRSAAVEAVAPTTVRIILDESDDIPPTGLFLGLNGRGYMLRPGLEVDIPLGLKEILDHAVISTPDVDPATKQIRGYRNRLKYTYRQVSI